MSVVAAPAAAAPYVRAALLCERVLCETDDTLSAIRILHEAHTAGGPLHLVLLVMLVRGEVAAGTRPAMLELRGPRGDVLSRQPIEFTLDDGGPEQASTLVVDVSFEPTAPGVHWFRLAWAEDQRLLTEVPLTVHRLAERTRPRPSEESHAPG